MPLLTKRGGRSANRVRLIVAEKPLLVRSERLRRHRKPLSPNLGRRLANTKAFEVTRTTLPSSTTPNPVNRATLPSSTKPNPVNRTALPSNTTPTEVNKTTLPSNFKPSPVNRTTLPSNTKPTPLNRARESEGMSAAQ
jgi:hypothetical protein